MVLGKLDGNRRVFTSDNMPMGMQWVMESKMIGNGNLFFNTHIVKMTSFILDFSIEVTSYYEIYKNNGSFNLY